MVEWPPGQQTESQLQVNASARAIANKISRRAAARCSRNSPPPIAVRKVSFPMKNGTPEVGSEAPSNDEMQLTKRTEAGRIPKRPILHFKGASQLISVLARHKAKREDDRAWLSPGLANNRAST
jgi:hypothetical protein